MTDIMLEALDADVAVLNAGTLRSDAVHPVGSFQLKDLMAILPMMDLLTVLRISGKKYITYLLDIFYKYKLTICFFNYCFMNCGNLSMPRRVKCSVYN